jgi:hypothetical protein
VVDLVECCYITDGFGFWLFCLEVVVESDGGISCAICNRLSLVFGVRLVGCLVSARATSDLLDFGDF